MTTEDEALREIDPPLGWERMGTMIGPAWQRSLSNGHTIIIHLRGGYRLSVHSQTFGFITWPTEGWEDVWAGANVIIANTPTKHGGNWTRAYGAVLPGARKPC